MTKKITKKSTRYNPKYYAFVFKMSIGLFAAALISQLLFTFVIFSLFPDTYMVDTSSPYDPSGGLVPIETYKLAIVNWIGIVILAGFLFVHYFGLKKNNENTRAIGALFLNSFAILFIVTEVSDAITNIFGLGRNLWIFMILAVVLTISYLIWHPAIKKWRHIHES